MDVRGREPSILSSELGGYIRTYNALHKAVMPSTAYVHRSTPSSLPSDSAIISFYPAAYDLNTTAQEQTDCAGPSNGIHGYRRSPGRSFPSSYITPSNPPMGPLPDCHGHRSGPYSTDSNENTPLLAPSAPRIDVVCNREDADESSIEVFREELTILAEYALPVLGYVPLVAYNALSNYRYWQNTHS